MKTSSFIQLSLLSILLVLSAFSCRKDDEARVIACSGKTGRYTATVVVGEAVCGYGVWDNLWLMDKNQLVNDPAQEKTWLMPFSLEGGVAYTPKPNEILEITYEETKDDGRYSHLVICMAYPGKHKPIHILCIKGIPKN